MASYVQDDPYAAVQLMAGSAPVQSTEESLYAEPVVSLDSPSSLTSSNLRTGSSLSSLSSVSGGDSDRFDDSVRSASGSYRPAQVQTLRKSLRKYHPRIDAECCSFWCRNFPSCHVAYQSSDCRTRGRSTPSSTSSSSPLSATSTTTSASSSSSSSSSSSTTTRAEQQDFSQYANHETPKTETVIRAIVREYHSKGYSLPVNPATNVVDTRFVDALSQALDPAGCGQVYPEYYFAMAATFGPFHIFLPKLLHAVCWCPKGMDVEGGEESEEESEESESKGEEDNQQEVSYFHGFASRSQCEALLREQCSDDVGGDGLGDGLVPGTFVLRFSTSRPGQLSISWVISKDSPKYKKQPIQHTALLNQYADGFVGDKDGGDAKGTFLKISDLLEYHKQYFLTPCVAKRMKSSSFKQYNKNMHAELQEEILKEWQEKRELASAEEQFSDPYAEADSGAYGEVLGH